MATKAVRFSEEEEKIINEFLRSNAFFDFSTLARMSIMNFVKNPEMKLNPVLKNKESNKLKSSAERIVSKH